MSSVCCDYRIVFSGVVSVATENTNQKNETVTLDCNIDKISFIIFLTNHNDAKFTILLRPC